MPFLNCPSCDATVYYRTSSALSGRSCTPCGAALTSPARQLSTMERMRHRAKLPAWLRESSADKGLKAW